MNNLLALILGASVSSGFSGKPTAEIIAERMGLRFENEAAACHQVRAAEVRPAAVIFNTDGFYWASYSLDCAAETRNVHEFFDRAKGTPVVTATVPDRNAGWFYRMVCGAGRSEQVCRVPINEAIRARCTGDCRLLDADAIYKRFDDGTDIHLTPEIWRVVAEEFGT